MTQPEKEQFLADLHVGVLALNDTDHGPLTVPVWYDYEPGGDLWFITAPGSRKGRLLSEGARVSLCAQTESAPYQYVSIEGPVTAMDPLNDELVPMAVRYLGEEMGKAYAANAGQDDVVVRVHPERWLAVDYGKAGS